MYTPPAFRMDDLQAQKALMRHCPFGILVSQGVDGLCATHIPFLLDDGGCPDDPGRLLGHMARANPHWQAFEGSTADAMVVFPGPHAYVSPTWYQEPAKNVPTWNYLAVHAYGPVRPLNDRQAARDILAQLSDVYEGGGPWSMDAMPDMLAEAMTRAIVAFEIPIARLEGKQKLSQNKSDADRAGVVDGLAANGQAWLAALVREGSV